MHGAMRQSNILKRRHPYIVNKLENREYMVPKEEGRKLNEECGAGRKVEKYNSDISLNAAPS